MKRLEVVFAPFFSSVVSQVYYSPFDQATTDIHKNVKGPLTLPAVL
jgi:hypothetical protein